MRKLGLIAVIAVFGCTTDVNQPDVQIDVQSDPDVSWSAYAPTQTEHGLSARNVDEGLAVLFDPNGATISGKMSEPMTLRLAAWGRKGATRPLSETEPTLGECASHGGATASDCVRRVQYAHGDVDEWFENGPSGVMHGWTLLSEPSGTGDLFLEIDTGTWDVWVEDAQTARLVSPGAGQLGYGGLLAWDANGAPLEAHFVERDEGVAIQVAADGAVWPLTVDPVLSTEVWSMAFPGTQFGRAANVGDVNRDGYADVALSGESQVSIYLGSANGLENTPHWVATGSAGTGFGHSMVGGDFNGDGWPDLAVGSNTAGRIDYFLNLSSSTTVATPDTSVTSGTSGYVTALLSPGDIDDDGLGDLLHYNSSAFRWQTLSGQGTPLSGVTISAASADAAVFGDALDEDGVRELAVRVGTADMRVYSYDPTIGSWVNRQSVSVAGDDFGRGIAGDCDLNGDGRPEIVVHINSSMIRAYTIDAGGTFTTQSQYQAQSGVSRDLNMGIACLGDLNGDGYGSYAVQWNGATASIDQMVTRHGSASGATDATDEWSFGAGGLYQIVPIGDTDGDGYGEFLTGPKFLDGGSATVYSETPSLPRQDGAARAVSGSGSFGYQTKAIGDFNGDGYGDFAVGAPLFENPAFGISGGMVDVRLGGAEEVQPANFRYFGGSATGAQFGQELAALGDVNGDGYTDILVGEPQHTNTWSDAGRVSLILGGAQPVDSFASWTVEGGTISAMIGSSIGGPGDVNGDGYADLALLHTDGTTKEAHVYYGANSSTGVSSNGPWIYTLPSNADIQNARIDGIGDVNNDGFGDFAIGNWNYDSNNDGDENGEITIFYGSVAGPGSTPDHTIAGPQGNTYLGRVVAAAGDVDGDGYDDFVTRAGSTGIWIWRGSSQGITGADPYYTRNIGDSDTGAIASGDFNNDGYSDLLIGAPTYDYVSPLDSQTYTDAGRIVILKGSAQGPSATPEFSISPETGSAMVGQALSVGDINGDGFGDLIAGWTAFDEAGIYFGNTGHLEGASSLGTGDAVSAGQEMSSLRARAYQPSSGISVQPGALIWPAADGSGSDRTIRIELRAKGAIGHRPTSVQTELKPLGTPFDGQGFGQSNPADNMGVGGWVTMYDGSGGLDVGTAYHWRARLVYDPVTNPHQPYSHWVYGGKSGQPSKVHFRTPCNGSTYYPDLDGDGFVDGANPVTACTQPQDYITWDGTGQTDCDDDPTECGVNCRPNITGDTCDGYDNNCDGSVDENPDLTWYPDCDGDGYTVATGILACSEPATGCSDGGAPAGGFTNTPPTTADCDDEPNACGADCYPGNPGSDVCDNYDQDCDSSIDEDGAFLWYRDVDGDGYVDTNNTTLSCWDPAATTGETGWQSTITTHDCDDDTTACGTACFPGNTVADDCDGYNQDCDATVDEDAGIVWYHDADGDGYVDVQDIQTVCSDPDGSGSEWLGTATTDDCDDDPNACGADCFPGNTSPDICDNQNQDCDASLDEDPEFTWYHDADGDGYADLSDNQSACDDPDGSALNWIDFTTEDDCDDGDINTYPGATETCGDGSDSDCDGEGGPDGDEDQDGYTWTQEVNVCNVLGDLCASDCNLDSDGDGILDEDEWGAGQTARDSDQDGDANIVDDDDDNDGIPTLIEGDADVDGVPIVACDGEAQGCTFQPDGIPNYLDTDSDGDCDDDGTVESATADADNDGVPDYLDCNDGDGTTGDADNDGLTNGEEQTLGTDGANPDSDGDGIGDLEEVGDVNNPTNTDGDSLINANDDDDDGDGLLTSYETYDGDADPTNDNTDGDANPDYLDNDDDGDGILTADESYDGDTDPTNDDTDGDGIENYLDAYDMDGPLADLDNDGLTNGEETTLGTNPESSDTDGDGIDDATEVGDVNDPTNTDGDGDINAVDLDDDNDGVDTIDELGDPDNPDDTDEDDIPNYLDDDDDNDGVLSVDEVAGEAEPPDTDGDLVPDYLDDDDDNDGTPTAEEDSNGDGDWYNDDLDGDGIPDFLDAVDDSDVEVGGTRLVPRGCEGCNGTGGTPVWSALALLAFIRRKRAA